MQVLQNNKPHISAFKPFKKRVKIINYYIYIMIICNTHVAYFLLFDPPVNNTKFAFSISPLRALSDGRRRFWNSRYRFSLVTPVYKAAKLIRKGEFL